MIDGGPIPDDDHKARGTAAERHLGLRLFRVRIRHAARMDGRRHGHDDFAVGDRNFSADVHQGVEPHLGLWIALQLAQVGAELEVRHQPRAGLLRDRDGVADMIKMAMRDQDVIDLFQIGQRVLLVFDLRVHRIREPGIDQQHGAVRRHDLKRRMPMPRQRGLRPCAGGHQQQSHGEKERSSPYVHDGLRV